MTNSSPDTSAAEVVALRTRLARFAGDARVTAYNGSAGQMLMMAGSLAAEAVAAIDASRAETAAANARAEALEAKLTKAKKRLPPIGEELGEFYPNMSAQTHEAAIKEYVRAILAEIEGKSK